MSQLINAQVHVKVKAKMLLNRVTAVIKVNIEVSNRKVVNTLYQS